MRRHESHRLSRGEDGWTLATTIRYDRARPVIVLAPILEVNGDTMPAYARYIATAGNNFLSNTWRESSEADTTHALERTALGFAARMSSNVFKEFWPDVRDRLFRRSASERR